MSKKDILVAVLEYCEQEMSNECCDEFDFEDTPENRGFIEEVLRAAYGENEDVRVPSSNGKVIANGTTVLTYLIQQLKAEA